MSNQTETWIKEWFPQRIISGEDPFALIILNQPFNEDQKLFMKKNWKSAVFHVAVDGGVNEFKNNFRNDEDLQPDLICGDFDSANPDILNYYKEKGIEVTHTPDQNETDFTKSLRLTTDYINSKNLQVSSIVVLSRNGDRLDHIIGNLNTLFLANEFTSIPVLIFGHGSFTWLLCAGSHKIHVTENMMDSHVGLFPLGSECKNVSTTGLKWNLSCNKMSFGGLISICNRFDGSEVVTVATDTPLIWTMEVKMDE